MKPKIKTTCTKLQLQLLSFCLLCLSGKTRCDGNGPAVVTVEQDSDAVLPCSLSSKENIESYLFDWKKAAQIDGGQKEVFHYDAGIHYNNGQAGQSEEFKGRVSHFPEELKHGNASIIIRNTTVADSGDYTCSFPDLQPPQTFHIKLVVAKKPSITTLEETKDWSRLQCEVRGASPKPKVEWKDSSGNILPAEPQVTDRGGSYDIILQTTVTKTDYYHCVVTQEEINHQTEAKIHVYISEPVVVTVKLDEDALLPCSLRTNKNIEQGYFDWNKFVQHNERQKEVFLYDKGRHSPNFGSQDEEFKGRVSHFPQELKHGNASIIIRNTKMADSGNYTCTFTEPRQTFHIELVVGGVLKDRSDKNIRAKKPFITTLEMTKDWSRLQCEVRGASPKPKVQWKDSSGNILPAEPQVTVRGDNYDIILQTTVTRTDYYHCVVTQEDIKHQAEAKIHVYISGPAVVTVEQGRDAVLPCSLSPKENIESYRFDWKKPAQIDGGQKEVFYYDAGLTYDSGRAGQSEEFKGRVSHFPEELKHGNAAIIIRNTKMADSGDYTCVFPDLQPPQTFHIELVVEPVVVRVEEDGDALLPCSLSTKENIEQGYFTWDKVAQNNEKQEVFLYDKGKHSNNGSESQDDKFKGRVFHFPQELKHGNASIIIRNTKMADSGDYTCDFTEPRQTFHIKLDVAKKPFITALEETKDWSRLQCVVRGASPKPKVEWKDSSGNILPAEKTQDTDRGGSYDIVLQTTVTRTDYYHCVVTQEDINHQTEAKIHVYISVNSGSGANSSGWIGWIGWIVAGVLGTGGAFALWRHKKKNT